MIEIIIKVIILIGFIALVYFSAKKVFKAVTAKMQGAKKGKYKWVIPPSAADFELLTSYTFAGKGRQGEIDMKFFEAILT